MNAFTTSVFWPAFWNIDAFANLDRMTSYYPNETPTKYPVRYLRYWFMRHLLERHAKRLDRPLKVLEVGVDRGQMLAFMGGTSTKLPLATCRWDAVDIGADKDLLQKLGYTDYIVADVDNGTPIPLYHKYDAIVFLHLLEHLYRPERCLAQFLPALAQNGILAGGSPTMPKLIADAGIEARLAHGSRPNGHVSILSPERIEAFSNNAGLHVSFLSGAYLVRKTGSSLENSAAWLRLNLAFGALFPSLGSEVYFALTRPN